MSIHVHNQPTLTAVEYTLSPIGWPGLDRVCVAIDRHCQRPARVASVKKEREKEWVAGYNTAPKQNPTVVVGWI